MAQTPPPTPDPTAPPRDPSARPPTDTDADGAFTFAAGPKGRYRLKASKARLFTLQMPAGSWRLAVLLASQLTVVTGTASDAKAAPLP